jgi:hypothetical protein
MFYKTMALVFLLLGGVFTWAAVRQHSWFYGAFAIITVINAFMSLLRSAAGETRS